MDFLNFFFTSGLAFQEEENNKDNKNLLQDLSLEIGLETSIEDLFEEDNF